MKKGLSLRVTYLDRIWLSERMKYCEGSQRQLSHKLSVTCYSPSGDSTYPENQIKFIVKNFEAQMLHLLVLFCYSAQRIILRNKYHRSSEINMLFFVLKNVTFRKNLGGVVYFITVATKHRFSKERGPWYRDGILPIIPWNFRSVHWCKEWPARTNFAKLHRLNERRPTCVQDCSLVLFTHFVEDNDFRLCLNVNYPFTSTDLGLKLRFRWSWKLVQGGHFVTLIPSFSGHALWSGKRGLRDSSCSVYCYKSHYRRIVDFSHKLSSCQSCFDAERQTFAIFVELRFLKRRTTRNENTTKRNRKKRNKSCWWSPLWFLTADLIHSINRRSE